MSTACGADKFAIRARGVKVRVVGHDVALLAHHVEEDAFGGAALMRGNNVAKSENGLNGIAKTREAGRAGVGFVAAHHRGPLFGGHGGSAGIGEQVDQDGFRSDQEEIVAGVFDAAFAVPRAWCARIGSTLLMRNGSMIVRMGMACVVSQAHTTIAAMLGVCAVEAHDGVNRRRVPVPKR